MKPGSKSYLTTRKAAELLGISLKTAQLWANTGVLRSWTTAGGHRRILQESVDELLEKRLKETQTIPVEKTKIDPPSTTSITILIVEDDPPTRSVLKQQLDIMKLPLNIITAEDGYKGLLATGQYKPELIITDLMMPGMDGFRMIQTIKKDKLATATKLLVISALSPQDIKFHGDLPDDVKVLQKPVLYKNFEQSIREYYSLITNIDPNKAGESADI